MREQELGIRKGPWSVQEDTVLVNYISAHGEGRWNSVARSAGLKRTGKSCRLRWLNYLRPDVRRGNITLQEQILILHLHSLWGNRWSKIAQYLPGRTDNEIKNYWRTRVIKQAKQLKCDVNSEQFRDAMRYVWMPRMLERVQAESDSDAGLKPFTKPVRTSTNPGDMDPASDQEAHLLQNDFGIGRQGMNLQPHGSVSMSISADSSEEVQIPTSSDQTLESKSCNYDDLPGLKKGSAGMDIEAWEGSGMIDRGFGGGDSLMPTESWWSDENIRFLRQQLCDCDE